MQVSEPSTYHHGDLKASLIHLARARVLASGAEAVSLRDLSREAGVSHAAAYRHFPTKEALLDVVATQGLDELTAACQAACDAYDDPLNKLQACGRAYVQFGRRNARLLALMFGEAGTWMQSKVADTPKSLAAAQLFSVLLGVVKSGQARGDIVAHDPHAVAWTCWAMVQGCASLAPGEDVDLAHLHRQEVEERIQWSIQAVVRGLQARPEGSETR